MATSYSRRTFIKKSGLTTLSVVALGGTTWGCTSPQSPEAPMLTIGAGEHTYAVNHGWAQVPTGKAFGYTHGIVEDQAGRLYIANQSDDAIMVFEPDGAFVTSWGAAYKAGAHGLTISEEGGEEFLYLANTDLAEVVKTRLDGTEVWRRGTSDLPGYREGQKYSPTETTVGPNGHVYVADGYGQSFVHVYTTAGEYVQTFGGLGDADGSLNGPHGITLDTRGSEPVVQIADRNNIRIVNYDLDGTFIGEVIAPDALRFPCTTVHRGDLLYIPDLFSRISIFDANYDKVIDLGDYVNGQVLDGWDDFGDTYPEMEGYPNLAPEKRTPGKFIAPHGMWVDQEENIYIVEWISDGRVTKLTKQG
ncbi:MAG: hypothetical protein AAF730_10010 [Bacteroidota bacterium]